MATTSKRLRFLTRMDMGCTSGMACECGGGGGGINNKKHFCVIHMLCLCPRKYVKFPSMFPV